MRVILAVCLALAGLAAPPALVQAATVDYVLDPDTSIVAFETDFGPDLITGAIPLAGAKVALDFASVANCRVEVTLDVTGATASFPFAAQALKGPKVLAAKDFPEMHFASTAVHRKGEAAEMEGMLTLRGVTRPVTLRVEILRPNGSAPDDLDHLTVRLTGAVKRSDFGATGWSDMVGDEVRIIITARIDRAG